MPTDATARLVGRQWEVALIRRELATAATGRLRLTSLTGEPGIGKSRLMASLTQDAAAQGMVVLQGGTSDAEGMPPYLPFLEALGPYIRTADVPVLARQSEGTVAILATILPELTIRLGTAAAPYSLPQEQARVRLFEALGGFLRAIAETSGLLLILDDLHWADPSTLDLLVHVARRQPTARILVLTGYRAAEANENAALHRALTELTRHRVLTQLTLGPLTRAELTDLTIAHLAGPVDEFVTDSLHIQSEGNPFFAEELLRDWLQSQSLERRDGRWQLVRGLPRDLPATIVGAVRERLTRVPPATRDVLRVAALIGRSFQVQLLADVVGRPGEDVEDELAPAVTAGLLQRRDGAYAFTHDTVRETASAEVGDTRRRRIHGAVGTALERMTCVDASRHTAELAFHYCRAMNGQKGVEYAIRAAEQAEETFAFAEALALYRDALKLTGNDDSRRGGILLRCGQAALYSGHEREAETLFEVVRGQSRQMDDTLMAGRSARGLALARWHRGDLNGAAVELEAAISLLKSHRGADTVRALVDMASLKNSMGQQPEGLAIAHHALDLALERGDEQLQAAACRVAGQLTAWGNDLDGGNRLLRRALGLAIAHDDPAEAAEICGILANTCFAGFDCTESRRVTLMRMELARRSHQPHEQRHVQAWLAELCVQQGNWEEADAFIAEAQRIVEQFEDDEPRAVLCRVRGRMAEYREQLDEAAQWYAEALTRIRPKGAQHLAWYLGSLARVELSSGNHAVAAALMTELEEALTRIPTGSLPTAPALTDAVEWSLQAGDVQRAHRHAEPLRVFGGRMFLSPVDLTLGRYELALGNRAAARTYLGRAERDARRAALRTQLLPILLEQAKAASREPVTVTGALEEALSLSEALGLEARSAWIRAQMPPLKPARLPAGLSRREVDVLRLVAAGRSNREIAGELVVSEKTVENHLTSVFNKTGTSNRAGATAFAIRQGLVE